MLTRHRQSHSISKNNIISQNLLHLHLFFNSQASLLSNFVSICFPFAVPRPIKPLNRCYVYISINFQYLTNRPFPRKIPLGISVAMATIFLIFHALQAWMAPFRFEVNWMFSGVDMTSQTYTHFIWAHMEDLVWRRLQCKSLIWAYINCV